MSATTLTVNVGSSSVKLALFDAGSGLTRLAAADVPRAGRATLEIWPEELAAHAVSPAVVVHRIVYGGLKYAAPTRLTPAVLDDLHELSARAPEHMPAALDAVATAGTTFPAALQFACFDTAFHQHMPPVARRYPLPQRYWDHGVRRYGFHGLSCESVMNSLRELDPAAVDGRVVIAHLGGGSSLTAVRDGRSVDTTMGFSPTGGVMMGSRSGDLDPGVLVHILQHEGLTASKIDHLVSHEAGLAGVSGRAGDMRELLAAEASDEGAAEAIALYCYLARKALGSLMAVLGGLDTLVFTGGIGEHAAPVRERICAGMTALGVRIDPPRNGASDHVISPTGAPVTVRIIASAEDRVLASHALSMLTRSS